MNGTDLKVLIHQGELEQIRHYIKLYQKQKTPFQSGDLYGLWRHSFQPVIQFVTGPAKPEYGDEYRRFCHNVVFSQHSLRRIGIWTSKVLRFAEINTYQIQELVDWDWNKVKDPSYFLIMLVTNPGETLTVEFFLWDMSHNGFPEVRKITELSADVLPGNSSFRIYKPLIDQLQSRISVPIKALEFTPKAAGEVLQVSTEQWYSKEQGLELLRQLNTAVFSLFPNAGMSSDPISNNIGFTLPCDGQEILLEFPRNFPDDSACLKPSSGLGPIYIDVKSMSPDKKVEYLITNAFDIIQGLETTPENTRQNLRQEGAARNNQQGRYTGAGQGHQHEGRKARAGQGQHREQQEEIRTRADQGQNGQQGRIKTRTDQGQHDQQEGTKTGAGQGQSGQHQGTKARADQGQHRRQEEGTRTGAGQGQHTSQHEEEKSREVHALHISTI